MKAFLNNSFSLRQKPPPPVQHHPALNKLHLLVKQTIVTCTTKYSSSPLELLLPPPTRPVVSAPTSLRLYLYVYTSRPSRPNVFVPTSIHLSLFVLKRIGETLYHFPFDLFSSQPHLHFFFLIFFAYSQKKHYLCGGFG